MRHSLYVEPVLRKHAVGFVPPSPMGLPGIDQARQAMRGMAMQTAPWAAPAAQVANGVMTATGNAGSAMAGLARRVMPSGGGTPASAPQPTMAGGGGEQPQAPGFWRSALNFASPAAALFSGGPDTYRRSWYGLRRPLGMVNAMEQAEFDPQEIQKAWHKVRQDQMNAWSKTMEKAREQREQMAAFGNSPYQGSSYNPYQRMYSMR